MESILTSIKKLLGISEDYDHFDTDLVMHINSVFMILNQLGVGPKECFQIEDESDTWDDFFAGKTNLASVKSYMYLKVKMLFDHSMGPSMMESIGRMANEFESRLNMAVDPEQSAGEEEIQNG